MYAPAYLVRSGRFVDFKPCRVCPSSGPSKTSDLWITSSRLRFISAPQLSICALDLRSGPVFRRNSVINLRWQWALRFGTVTNRSVSYFKNVSLGGCLASRSIGFRDVASVGLTPIHVAGNVGTPSQSRHTHKSQRYGCNYFLA